MKKNNFLLLILILCSFLISGCKPVAQPITNKLAVAPNFQLNDLSGKSIMLNTYKDKNPVILFFWTTWCPFCRVELKTLNENYSQFKKDGVELLAIDVGEPAYKVENMTKSYGLTFRVLMDKDSSVADSYEILGVPTYILIDKKGNIRFEEHSFPKDKYKILISE